MRLVNDERGDIITMLRQNNLSMPADDLCYGLVEY